MVHNNNFATLNEYNDESNTSSSHEEILNSEFGQTVREIVPSGRTVLGILHACMGLGLCLQGQLD